MNFSGGYENRRKSLDINARHSTGQQIRRADHLRTCESVPRQAMKSLTNLINALSGEGNCNCANGVI